MRSLARWTACAVMVALVALFARPAAAQQVRGTVRDSASQQPIPGAVVLVLDSAGRTLGRNITAENGTYRLALTGGMRRVRMLRIGFRPREVAIPAPVGGVAVVDVVMQSLPTMLEAVRVTDQSPCPRQPDTRAALALWEQARTGLLATIVARTAQPAMMTRLNFDRLMMGNSDDIAYQRVRIDSAARTPTSYNAAHSAADFVKYGFMEERGGQQVFNAPDADVLVDEAFARGYCFHLVRAERPRPRAQVGLAFEAANHEPGRIDIDGALWIDTVARAIRDVEFRYVGLDSLFEELHPGGRVAFRGAANGIVFVDRWALRLLASAPLTPIPSSPIVAKAAVILSRRKGPVRVSDGMPDDGQRVYVEEVGGEVAEANWPDGTTWKAALGTFRGTILRDSVPVGAGVSVVLHETDYQTLTDANGRFELTRLLPGPYRVDVSDSEFVNFGLVQDSSIAIVAERDSVISGRYGVATMDRYIRGACRRRTVGKNILMIRAVRPDNTPAADVRITVSAAANPLGPFTPIVSGRSGKNGELLVCTTADDLPLPTAGVLKVQVLDEKFASDPVEIDIEPHMRLLTAFLVVNPRS